MGGRPPRASAACFQVIFFASFRVFPLASSVMMEVEDGKVRVVIDLPPNHQFASAIREEVVEKIEPLWDVEEVEVIFTD